MRKCWFSLCAVMTLLLAVLPFTSVTRAQEPSGLRPRVTQDPDRDPKVTPNALKQGRIAVFVELTGQPAVVAYAARKAQGGTEAQATAEGRTVLAQNLQAQQRVLPMINALKTPVLYRTQRVLNGIAVKADANQQAALARLPGVRSVKAIPTYSIENATSVPLIGAPELWRLSSAIGYTGEGISIGVIDTGVDYLHTDFGGPGTGYDTNDTTRIDPDEGFPNEKVVGGYDFAGDDYDGSDPSSVPQPDPDPMDCNGHGSHVAGTATGYGVNADGSTYTGPYNASVPFDSMRIGPGVAPEADLYALRVFGCGGSTNLTEAAIEWSVDPNGDGNFEDHLDVINMSLGSDFGSNGDTSAVASNNAALAGVLVATSAGNSGDTYYISGSPGTADRVVSTASSVDSTSVTDGFRVNSPPELARVHPAFFSSAYDWTNSAPVTGTLVFPASQPSGCQAFNADNQALINGKVVLLQWTEISPGAAECGSIARARNVTNAGGIGVIMYDNSENFDLLIFGSDIVPSVSTPLEVGETLRANIDKNISVTFSEEFRNSSKIVTPELIDTLSAFSSRGPTRHNGVKPDIAAPGQTVFSAASGTGDDGASFNGTSMASPHVAGALALLREIHPDWSVEELKALIMNTAGQDIRSGADAASATYGPTRQGTGRVTLPAAAASSVVAYNADGSGTVSVSFGEVEVVNTASMTRTVRLVNKGTTAQTFNLSYLPVTEIPGVSFSVVGPTSITLAGGASQDVVVRMTANASQMKHTRDETVSDMQLGNPRHWLSEIQGYLVATPTGNPAGRPALRVSLYATARPASDMRSAQSAMDFTDGSSNTIRLAGKPVATGTSYPTDTLSLVSVLELKATSPNEGLSEGDANEADLNYVGIASDFGATEAVSETMLYIGIATHGEWATPSYANAEFDIYFDTNGDGEDDYVMFNGALSTSSGDLQDVFVTTLIDLNAGAIVDRLYLNGASARIDTNVFNNSVMVLPVSAAALGLTDANSSFSIDVVAFSRAFGDGPVDIVEDIGYDVANPGIDTTGAVFADDVPHVQGVTYPDVPSTEIPVNFDRAAFEANGSEGILLLHHHNTDGENAEVVLTERMKIRLPLVAR